MLSMEDLLSGSGSLGDARLRGAQSQVSCCCTQSPAGDGTPHKRCLLSLQISRQRVAQQGISLPHPLEEWHAYNSKLFCAGVA